MILLLECFAGEVRCMDNAGYVGPTAVRAAVLPARVAYLVADGSENGFRRAVQEACTRWAGMTEPVIPVPPGGELDWWSDQAVSLARVDAVVNVDVNPDDAAAVAGSLGLDLIALADIDSRGISAFTVHPLNVGLEHAAGSSLCVMSSDRLQLWEVAGAGDLSDAHWETLPRGRFYARRPHQDEVARAQLANRTLIELTCVQFGEHWARGLFPGPAVVWVTEPDSFSDCVNFWNLRALRPLRLASLPMLLLPAGLVQFWMDFAKGLAHVLERPAQFAPDVAFCSSSVSEDVLHETARLLGIQQHEGPLQRSHEWPVPTRKPPFTYQVGMDPRGWLSFERSYGQVTDVDLQLFRGMSTVRFPSPVSFGAGGTVLTRLSGPALEGLPRRPAVAELIAKGASWQYETLQITARAVNEYLFEIHVPELPEVTAALLSRITTRHELSRNKGQAGMAWLEQTDISSLAQPGVFTAIRELTTPRSNHLTKELRRLAKDGVITTEVADIAARWGGRSERKCMSAGQLNYVPEEHRADALERLCAAGWAERGLRLACDACGLPSFVAFGQVTGQASCPGCSSPARYETGAALEVHYRLNSHLDMLSDQGVLPHLLTITALRLNSERSHFLPGVDVWFSQDSNDKAEADIFGVRDGKILSGEVKTSASEFTPEQITRDVELSVRLEADTHVLAATDDVLPETVERAQQLCKTNGLDLITLGKSDLLPWG